MSGRALIVGGGGMLTEASRHIGRHFRKLTLASRNPSALAESIGAASVPLDWGDRGKALESLNELKNLPAPDLLVSWLHDDGIWLVEGLEALLPPGGRSIRLHGAASGDPSVLAQRNPGPRDDIPRQTVVIGWMPDGAGRRWLTHSEISGGVIAAFDAPETPLVTVGRAP